MGNFDNKNNLLKLEREFKTKKHPPIDKSVSFYGAAKSANISIINDRVSEFESIFDYFKNDTYLNGYCVFTVFCKKIMAKSNRLTWLLTFNDGKKANEWVVGSSFYGERNEFQQIVYAIPRLYIPKIIEKLNIVKTVFERSFGEIVTKEQLDYVSKFESPDSKIFEKIKKTYFIDTIQQLTFIKEIKVDLSYKETNKDVIVNLIKLPSISSKEILKKLGIQPLPVELPDDMFLLDKNSANKLVKDLPYLVITQTVNFSTYDLSEIPDSCFEDEIKINDPKNEPIIGVIDGLFAKNGKFVLREPYFTNWVENIDMLEPNNTPDDVSDYAHGTEVDSLLVDLPTLNPQLDDGCGHFRVRHFGIATRKGVSVTYMLKVIRAIVEDPKNSDIQVWNLCLGNGECEINKSYISLEGALLDELQSKNENIVFVVSGTNKKLNAPSNMKIGAPADSINSIVVNSCTIDETPASYSRCGPALSFFIKPDVSTFGGDTGQELFVWSPWGKWQNCGTSFAAPLVSRKLAFLMGVMKLDRTVAKALLIDSVLKWNNGFLKQSNFIGRGIVQPDIKTIVKGESDEIKFFIQGKSKEYSTYTYSLPVPICADNKYHYRARATLCYFPTCSRNQGIDYTNTELSVQLGRLKKGNKGIDTIDKYRYYLEAGFLFESDAREYFRKWDNIKTIIDSFPERNIIGKDVINEDNTNWGISVSYTERSSFTRKSIIDWGLVVTLKATDGINRISDFIHDCEFNGWLVTPIIYENFIEIQSKLEEDINLE